ncbi:MAG: M14 family metallopeptidase [Pirellulaceae bacterium]
MNKHSLSLLALCALLFSQFAFGQNPALEGYANHEAYSAQVKELDASDLVAVSSLGKSIGGRDVWLLTVGSGKTEEKPAIAIVGNVQGSHLTGGEIALRMARKLAEKAKTDEATRKLLEEQTFYFIPRPDPDGCEKSFLRPLRLRAGNDRKTDDDRDFAFGEDPPDDLNGDGIITMMRVEDETGDYFPHPDDARVLIQAEAKKNEKGKYRLLIEGKDDDKDEKFNEDPGDGVAFNHNFTFGYKPFQAGAGANAVSEPECRVVADFLFGRPNVAVLFCFSPEDNLFHTWKPDPDRERDRIRKRILGSDAALIEYIAGEYRKIHGGSDAPGPPDSSGSFSQWGYFHYGRWSFAARGWWVPKTEEPKPEGAAKKPSGEKRGESDLNVLRWLAKENLDGFVDWKPVEHPDFPGKKVEVGGFKPFYSLNPPAKDLDGLADKHLQFAAALHQWLPKLALIDAKAEALGSGVYRITATAVNRGFLSTMPEMGQVNGENYPLQIALTMPKGAELLQGSPRAKLPRLEGSGGKSEKTWLLKLGEEKPRQIEIQAWAPAVGRAVVKVDLP